MPRRKKEPIDLRLPLAVVGGVAATVMAYEIGSRLEWMTKTSVAGTVYGKIRDTVGGIINGK